MLATPKHSNYVDQLATLSLRKSVEPPLRVMFPGCEAVSQSRGTCVLADVTANDNFIRSYVCYRFIRGIAEKIPNFPYLAGDTYYIDQLGVYAQIRELPATMPYAHLLIDQNVDEMVIVSIFLQVIHAIIFANHHARFAHNDLRADEVLLHEYAPLFTINYDMYSICCFKWLAIVRPCGGSQISYVSNNNVIVDLPPLPSVISEMIPHASTDIYMFLRSCLITVRNAAAKIPHSEMRPNMRARSAFFLNCMRFFCDTDAYYTNAYIAPYSSPEAFLHHVHERLPYSLVRLVSPMTSNVHLKFPPVDTWHAQDLTYLVATKPPQVQIGPYSLILPQQYRYALLCSRIVHDAAERLIDDRSSDPLTDVRIARVELPILLFVHRTFPELFSEVLATKLDINLTIGEWCEKHLK